MTSDEGTAAAQLREPPTTGHVDLDEALLSVTELGELTLAEQLGALTAAHERVNSVLAAARSQPTVGSQSTRGFPPEALDRTGRPGPAAPVG